jgi:glycerate dehydrogenase
MLVILDSATTDRGEPGWWDALSRLGRIAVHPRTAPDQTAARIADAQLVLTNKVRLDAALIAEAPHLRYIGVMATGYNVVDVQACRDRGIAVTNVPGYSTDSVAQLVFAFLLTRTHDVAAHDRAVRDGAWTACPDFSFSLFPLTELAGKTLVIVGSGAIGDRVASIARAFGMEALRAQVPGSSSADRVPLTEALSRADVVTLHCRLSPDTAGLVDDRFMAALKPGAVLVNTGRGELIDEDAVIRALASGRLGGLCVDVLRREPPPAGHPLLDRGQPWSSRALVTPHIGWATVEARRRLAAEVIANALAYASGEERNRIA